MGWSHPMGLPVIPYALAVTEKSGRHVKDQEMARTTGKILSAGVIGFGLTRRFALSWEEQEARGAFMADSDWEKLLEVQRIIQKHFPECVLYGRH